MLAVLGALEGRLQRRLVARETRHHGGEGVEDRFDLLVHLAEAIDDGLVVGRIGMIVRHLPATDGHRLPVGDDLLELVVDDLEALVRRAEAGIGARIARREALARLRRPWFAGGTVDYASVQLDRHRLIGGEQAYEDGTPNFLGIGMIGVGLDFIAAIGSERLSRRLRELTACFIDGLVALRHPCGSPLVRLYGPEDSRDRGATVAFNVLDAQGRALPFLEVEQRAGAAGVAMRGGCFCNPGCAESAFGFPGNAVAGCLDRLGDAFSIPRFAACLGSGIPVGALRASFGAPTNLRDIERALGVIASFAESGARRRTASRRA